MYIYMHTYTHTQPMLRSLVRFERPTPPPGQMYIYIFVCIYKNMYMYIHTYTHTKPMCDFMYTSPWI